jgi:two-component system, LuxR family, sensor kinase FixL
MVTAPARMIVLLDRGHLRQLGTPIIVASVVMLVSAVLLLSVNVSALRQSFDWVQRSDDVLLEVSEIENAMIGHELTIRGYALTNDPVFLSYEKNEVGRIEKGMSRLGTLVSADSGQVVQFDALRRSLDRHTAMFRQLTALGPGHGAEVARAIRDPSQRALMATVRDGLAAFRNVEVSILKKRQAAVARQASRTFALAVGIVVAAFLLGALGVVVAQYGREPV